MCAFFWGGPIVMNLTVNDRGIPVTIIESVDRGYELEEGYQNIARLTSVTLMVENRVVPMSRWRTQSQRLTCHNMDGNFLSTRNAAVTGGSHSCQNFTSDKGTRTMWCTVCT